MSIIKLYEVRCDGCGKTVETYANYKPSLKDLRKNNIVKIKNGHVLIWCEACFKKWQEKHANRK